MIVPLPERCPDIPWDATERHREHMLRVYWHHRREWPPGTYGRRLYTIDARRCARELRELRRAHDAG